MGQVPRAMGSDEYQDVTGKVDLDGGFNLEDPIFKAIAEAKQIDNFKKAAGEAAWTAVQNNVNVEIPNPGIVIAPVKSVSEISDGDHTLKDLYFARMLLNAALFNEWSGWNFPHKRVRSVQKSKLHADGTMFEGGWFIVMAEVLQRDGSFKQISFHYEILYWDLFQINPRVRAAEWDGHDAQEAYRRIGEFLSLGVVPDSVLGKLFGHE